MNAKRSGRPKGWPLSLCLSLLALSLATACNTTRKPQEPPAAIPAAEPRSVEPPANPRFRDSRLSPAERAADLLSYMSLDEKIGQMTQAARDFIQDDGDIAAYGIGSVLSGGGSAPPENSPRAWAGMVDRYQAAALKGRLGIPLLYGIDSVHGNNNLKGAVIFPHNIGLGATRDPQLVEEIARATALETAAVGIDWTFSPCVAVPQDERWGRTYEGFSEDTALVSQLAAAAVRGYQSRILACAKHFIGDGATTGGVDRGDADIDEDELRARFLPPYREAIAAGVGSVMVSFNSWRGVKMHQQKYLIDGLLKGEMGFRGFVVSDWAGVKELPGSEGTQIASAVNSGIDMVMVPDTWKSFIALLRKQVQSGAVSRSRIDDAVRRILEAKFSLGLFEHPFSDPALLSEVGAPAHRELARRAVRESLVVLKNEKILPLPKKGLRIAVVGAAADDIGSQCGGWTISWQGQRGHITEGTTVLEAIREAVGPEGAVQFSADGSGLGPADAIILVAAEAPYAEMKGDDPDLAFPADAAAMFPALAAQKAPIVTILLSGRPLLIKQELEASRAFIAAWLPGTEAKGIADLLFGDFAPRGTLPYTWFDSVSALPINAKQPGPGVLFPFGFGLSWPDRSQLARYPSYPGYQLDWVDEFDGPDIDPSIWARAVGPGNGNNELQYYTNSPSNARIEDGKLIIEARKEKKAGWPYTSAKLQTLGRKSMRYGRIEARAKLPRGTGSWPAIWMLPENGLAYGKGWPDSGEIDIMEHVGFDPGVVHFTVHTSDYNHKIGTQRTAVQTVADADAAFHTYAMEWTPDAVRTFVDGHQGFEFKREPGDWRKWPFDTPFYLILNLACGGDWGGQRGMDAASLPWRMEIDWVRAYGLK